MHTGLFFVLPCIENYQKVDLRTITLDVPPQEVKRLVVKSKIKFGPLIVFEKVKCYAHLVKCTLDVSVCDCVPNISVTLF